MTGTYEQGYRAGRRRAKMDDQASRRMVAQEEFERQVFLAVLPELIRNPWQVGDNVWDDMSQFVAGARKFARLSANKFSFLQPLPPLLDSEPQEEPKP